MIKRVGMFVALVGLVMFAGGGNAEQTIAGGMSAGDGDADAGKTKSELCQGCHGVDGISIDPTTFPNLAGQYAGYIYKQVKDFQLGNRHDDTMSAMAAMVTTRQDLKDIAVYYASQAHMKAQGAENENGARIYASGNKKLGEYGACVRCHGENGKGMANNSLFPVIGGQQKAYLVKQLKDFRDGKRVNDPAGMMTMVAQGLTDKEIEDVAEYLASR